MSADLFQREIEERLSQLPGTQAIEPGVLDNFLRGTGTAAMQTFAKAGRAASMGVGGALALVDRAGEMHPLGPGTSLADRYFKMHDEVFGSAVDYWTPRSNDIGVAGQVVGQLLATLPMVIASPAGTVAATGLGTAEDLARKGVDSTKATAVGLAQAAGLGLGIWLPVLGQNLAQRVLIGGAGFNVAQGVVTRGASEAILEGTPGAEDFKAFDGTALTLDLLLGMAFGGLVHLNPKARAQGAEYWDRIRAWTQGMAPSQIDALITLRAAQHLNADTVPGRLAEPQDLDAHVQRVRKAIDQLARDGRVEVEDMPAPRVEADAARMREMERNAAALVQEAERVAKAQGIETEGPQAPPSGGAEPPPPRGIAAEAGPARPEADPIVREVDQVVQELPDLEVRVGADTDGNPLKMKLRDYVADVRQEVEQTRSDAKLFEVAAACMLGAA